ncbi:hypothetical protein M514_16899 [Trichuris suis]|uniref:Uncharacterized protein n=1 Tax=Trichuris suis TaxID=68888 RepID=A0A085NMT1_9BILA|nr:hypothetical protein M514_16899 [Trichuris suis]
MRGRTVCLRKKQFFSSRGETNNRIACQLVTDKGQTVFDVRPLLACCT